MIFYVILSNKLTRGLILFRLALALLCLISGLALASQHPLWPTAALALFYVWVVVVAWRPWIWLFLVPAGLPFLNFWPWTGWQALDEFDLLLLGALAGGYAHSAIQGQAGLATAVSPLKLTRPTGYAWLMVALVAATGVSLLRGLMSAGLLNTEVDSSLAASQALTYESVWNVLRIAKSFVFALLFAPLWTAQMQTEVSRQRVQQLFASGMLVGLTVVTLVALWERAAYPGWLEFSTRYRTTALFWEMHVGGAAIDAYLVIATPFLGWALVTARRPAVWLGLALLAILTCYAVLTTFSRGVYVAVLVPLMLLGLGAWARKRGFSLRRATARTTARLSGTGWRARAGGVLALLLVSEVLGVVFGGSFIAERVASAQDDLDSRVEHWRRGIQLLQTPADWVFGKGLGRLPALYAQISPETEFSGSIRLERRSQPVESVTNATPNSESSDAAQVASAYQVKLFGPQSNPQLAGLFSLTQRIDFSRIAAYTVSLQARAQTESDLHLKICEKHLIYEANCHFRFLKIRPRPNNQWQTLTIALRGRSMSPSAVTLPRFGVFSMSLINVGGALAVQKVGLVGPGGTEILQNGDFSRGLSRWLSSSQSYYLPWHIDNAYVELLIERGLLGLLLMGLWVVIALNGLARSTARTAHTAPTAPTANDQRPTPSLTRYVWACLVGVTLIGLVSSWLDVPRIAFLIFMLLFYSVHMSRSKSRDLGHDHAS